VSEIVEHGAHLSMNRAGDERMADSERAALHEDRGDRPARAIEPGLQDHAGRQGRRIGLQVQHVGGQEDHLQQIVDTGFLLGGDLHRHNVTTPVLDQETLVRELLLHAIEIDAGFVDLVDRDDHRHARCAAWCIASVVCGMTPSSAATTRITISVTLAPRARIMVNASWPGVSMNVMPRARRRMW